MPSLTRATLTLCAVVAVGCSSNPGNDGGAGGEDAGPQGGRTISVSLIDTHHASGSPTFAARDTRSRPLRAIVARPEGGFDTFEGHWTDAGIGEIQHVPDASYYLQWSDFSYVVTDESTLDLGQDVLGRPDVPVANVATGTTLQLTGNFVAPWADGDDLQFHSLPAGYLLFDVEDNSVQLADGGSSKPVLGDTALNLTLDWGRMRGPLLEAAQNDEVVVTKAKRSYLPSPLDGGSPLLVRTLSESASSASVTIADGTTPVLSMPLQAVATNQTVTLDWRRSDFAALRSLAHPDAVGYTDNFYVDVLPYTADAGFYTSAPDLLVVEADPEQPATISTTLSYGNPFSPGWPVFGQAVQTFLVRYRPNSGSLRAIRTGTYVADLISAFNAAPQRPLLVPVSHFTIDGQNATEEQVLTTPSPILSWIVPAVGTPQHYTVVVHEFTVNGSTTNVEPVAFIWTSKAAVRIPPFVLSPGHHYVFEVIAYQKSRADLAQHPYRSAFPEQGAGALSALMSFP